MRPWKSPAALTLSQPRIYGLAFQGEDAEDALMHAPQRLPANETLQTFDPKGELSESERLWLSPRLRKRDRFGSAV
jgi:hypothetical protein